MVEGSVDIENDKTLQHRQLESILKKFVRIEFSGVEYETKTLTMLTLFLSCDEDFMQESKIKPVYIKHKKNKNYVYYGEY